MKKFRHLFITNTARAGSYVTAQALSTNDQVNIASEPYLDLFKSLRNEILYQSSNPDLLYHDMNNLPFLDYYFSNKSINVMDYIQSSSIDIPFRREEWERLLPLMDDRAKLQVGELRPFLNEIYADNYYEALRNAFDIITKGRNLNGKKWIGIKDAWIVELFLPLARTFPDAKFMIMLRDPRASIASNLNVRNKNMIAHSMSFARNWRKLVAFAAHYSALEEFKGRLFISTHEQFLQDPEKKLKEMCAFLEIKFQDKMLNTNNYVDFSTGKVWKGNSSFEETTVGLSKHRIDRWKAKLTKNEILAVELICCPDINLIEQFSEYENEVISGYGKAVEFLLKDSSQSRCWRTDSGVHEMDYGPEFFRRSILTSDPDFVNQDLIRRCFLFRDVYDRLREGPIRSIV